MESYLHPEPINAVFGINITFADMENCGGNVPKLVVAVVKKDKSNPMRAAIRDGSDLLKWESNAKNYLNDDVAARMTLGHLDECDTDNEIEGWLRKISELIE